MAINKNFVVKNGLEVNENLVFADADTNKVGIGTTTPDFTLEVNGGIGATTITISGFSTFREGLQVGTSGSVFYVDDTNHRVGIGTSIPEYLLDVRTSVSTGQTGLYVQGDATITGDVTTDVTLAGDVSVSGLSTFVGFSTFNDYVSIQDGLQVTGAGITATTATIEDLTDNRIVIVGTGGELEDDANLTFDGSELAVGSAITAYVASGIISATSFYGDGSNLSGIATDLTATIGVSSEGTFVGSGITQIDFATTTGINIQSVDVDTTSGIATVTIQPGVSLGLAIALGG